MISQNWGTPDIDLFASRTCHQFHTYMVWRPDPHSQATDALQQKWKNLGLLYALPPFSLTGRVLLRVREEGLTMILVTPNWPAQPWYSQILDLCITESLLLPQSQELLVDPKGQVHPLVLNKTLKLMAWKISGKTWLRKEFQTRLPILSQIPEDQALQLITNRPGKNGLAGVVKNRLIQLHAV